MRFFFFFFLFEYFVCIKFHYLWYCPSQRLVHGPSEITDCCEMEGVVHVLVEKFSSTIRDFEIVFALIHDFPFFNLQLLSLWISNITVYSTLTSGCQ